MPEAGQPPGGETTVPPPPMGGPTVPPGLAGGKVFFAVKDGKVELPSPPVVPSPKRVFTAKRPVPRRRLPPRWWLRQLLPLAGLALMVGCLYGLLGEFPLAGWWPGGVPGTITGTPGGNGAVAVVIDPGHGGVDSGAVALGLQEKWLNLDVAQRVAAVLEHAGIHVLMTRTTDQAVSLEERVRIANGTPGAVFVSIHFNDALSSEHGQSYHASGVETYYSEHKEAGLLGGGWMWSSLFGGRTTGAGNGRDALAWSQREGAALADAIQGSLVLATSAADRGIKERALYVTRRVRAPAVLVEGGFISHPTEAKRLGDSAYRQKLAEAIATGIIHYLQAAAHAPTPGPASKPAVGA